MERIVVLLIIAGLLVVSNIVFNILDRRKGK